MKRDKKAVCVYVKLIAGRREKERERESKRER